MLTFTFMSRTGPQIFVSSGLDRRLPLEGMDKYEAIKRLVIPHKEKESSLPRQTQSENTSLFELLLLSPYLHSFMLDPFPVVDPTALSVQ